MCNCISKYSAPDLYKPLKGKTVTAVDLPTAMLWFKETNTVKAATVSVATLTIDGQKSKAKVPLSHTFCPFCGEKYEPDVIPVSPGGNAKIHL